MKHTTATTEESEMADRAKEHDAFESIRQVKLLMRVSRLQAHVRVRLRSHATCVRWTLLLDLMLPSVTTLTSICEHTETSFKVEQDDLKPFNWHLISEDYLKKLLSTSNGTIDPSAPGYCPSTNYKQLFRLSHLHASHPSRASLWYHILRQDHTRQQHKFQQAIERYPDDIR